MPPETDILDRGDVLTTDTTSEDKTTTTTEVVEDKTVTTEEQGEKTVVDSLTDKEDEETDAERAEREAREAEDERKKRIRIPKSRFDEAMQKARAKEDTLNQRIRELEERINGKQEQTKLTELQTEIEKLQDEYEELILDGKKDEARKVRKQVDAMRDELIDAKTTAKSDAARRAAIDDLKYDSALANMEAQYPALNPDSDEFDPDTTSEVGVLMEAFMARGFARTAALQKSVKYVLGEPAKKGDTDTADAIRARRAEEARRKAAEAAGRQPPSTKAVGLDSDKGGKPGENAGIDIMRLSQDKFAKLDEDTKAKLRGDDL